MDSPFAPDKEEIIDKQFKILVKDENLRNRLGSNAKKETLKYSWNERTKKILEYITSKN